MNETSSYRRFLRKSAIFGRSTLLAASATLAILTGAMDPAQAMDTDIFAATSSSVTAPNVLIIIDNSSNWSNNKQHFPSSTGSGTMYQAQAEAEALSNALSSLPGHINIGLMEFVTGGPGTDFGGFVRSAISPVGSSDTNGATNLASLKAIMTDIYNNYGSPDHKTSQNVPYGDLMYDAYNYLGGLTPYATSADVVASLADSNGYTSNYTKFKSPLSTSSSCGTTYIIFIANAPPNPKADTSTNLAALKTLGGDTTQLPLPNYTQKTVTLSDNLGYSSGCYSSQPTSTTDSVYQSCQTSVTAGSYDSCSYSTTGDTSTALDACPTGQSRYSVLQTTPGVATGSTTTTTTSTNSGTTNSCYYNTTSWSPSTDTGTTPTCPTSTSTTSGGTTTNTNYTCSYSVTSTGQTTTGCSNVTSTVTGSSTTSTSLSNSCYSNVNSWGTSDKGTLSCPATTTSTSNGVTTTTSYSCVYTAADSGKTSNGSGGTCGNNKTYMTVTQTAIPTTTTGGQQYKFPITQTVTKTVTTGTTAPSTVTTLGNTFSCYSSAPTGTPTDYTCASGSTCSYGSATTSAVCPSGKRFQVLGNYAQLQNVATGTFSTDTATYNADEWARFMHNVGVPVGSTKQSVMTYTIDVYNQQPSASVSSLLSSMARNGGGKYFSAQTEAAILAALKSIFAEIQAVNNTFASAALPISATNRAQNSNQVYIGMFRPDQGAHPRWFGNLKRYQVGKVGGFDGLVGSDNAAAVSNTTGFVTPCAVSFWTTSSTNYWYDTTNDLSRIFITQATSGNSGTAWDAAGNDDNFSKGSCDTTTQWSDSPDGPTVEKGGAAQMLRNNFASRKMYTISSATTGASTLSTFDTSVTGISSNSTINSNTAKFIMGQDVTGEVALSASANARPSIHGDVIHSRPLPVDHGGTTGVVIYYGAGDGVYHAVQGSTGQELWGFVAPESYSTLQRLMDNTPLVLTPNPTPPGQTAISGTTGRDFFFDGSTGVYQNSANTKVWIYPAMRRGGRMLYAFDVSTPTSPTLKWRRGCFDLASDANCTTGMSGIGQTWSTPQVAKVNGYASGGTNLPVIIVGGGYDTCEDSDTTTPSCSSPKGSAVYVLDADTGSLLKTFSTSSATNASSGPSGRSIAADVALVDSNGDGVVDYAYAADTGGNLYRIDFPSTASSASDWTMTKVAYTNITPSNSYRKFLFAPAVLPYKGDIFVSIVSGDREHPLALSYPYTTPVLNRAYLYLDDPTRTTATDLDGPKMVNESTGPDCNATKVLPGGTNYGWYMDLKAACSSSTNGCGEQGVTSALIFGGMVTWSTNRPTGAAETCSTSLGEARGYFANLLNGSGAIGVTGTCGGSTSTVFPGGGLPPSAVAATVNVDGKEETILIGAPCKDGTSCAPIQAQKLSPPISSKRSRTYWKLNTDNK